MSFSVAMDCVQFVVSDRRATLTATELERMIDDEIMLDRKEVFGKARPGNYESGGQPINVRRWSTTHGWFCRLLVVVCPS